MALFFLGMTLCAAVALLTFGIIALAMGRWTRALLCAALLCLTTFAYAAALAASAALSRERLLAAGETKRFCGAYLDCHLGVRVEGVERREAIGGVRSRGAFHVVTVRVSSDAVRATLRPERLEFALVDVAGNRYERAHSAESALAAEAGIEPPPLERPVPPGGSYAVRIVFDVPPEALAPRLLAREGAGVMGVLERVLIGDEDAFGHRARLLALPAPEPGPASGSAVTVRRSERL
jgi:hypothetical protein